MYMLIFNVHVYVSILYSVLVMYMLIFIMHVYVSVLYSADASILVSKWKPTLPFRARNGRAGFRFDPEMTALIRAA